MADEYDWSLPSSMLVQTCSEIENQTNGLEDSKTYRWYYRLTNIIKYSSMMISETSTTLKQAWLALIRATDGPE